MTGADFHLPHMALVGWRECRGGGSEGMRAVLWSIKNRVDDEPAYGVGWMGVIYKTLQYSSMTYPSDPQLNLYPADGDPLYAEALSLATAIENGTDTSDPTGGATNYYAASMAQPPHWAGLMAFTVEIGGQRFYK